MRVQTRETEPWIAACMRDLSSTDSTYACLTRLNTAVNARISSRLTDGCGGGATGLASSARAAIGAAVSIKAVKRIRNIFNTR